MKKSEVKIGTKVICNGYPGSVVGLCEWSDSLVEVRVPGGVTCVGASEIVPTENVEVVSENAFQEAKRMAKYGHRNWLVWEIADGTHHAAKMTKESLAVALAECGFSGDRPLINMIHANCGTGMRASAGLVKIWKSNLELGMM